VPGVKRDTPGTAFPFPPGATLTPEAQPMKSLPWKSAIVALAMIALVFRVSQIKKIVVGE